MLRYPSNRIDKRGCAEGPVTRQSPKHRDTHLDRPGRSWQPGRAGQASPAWTLRTVGLPPLMPGRAATSASRSKRGVSVTCSPTCAPISGQG
jgi:hypothetical protein